MKFKTAYENLDQASFDTGVACADKSLAQQHMRDETDINIIVGRFLKTGVIPQGLKLPSYADFADVTDFQSAQNVLVAADREFMKIPAQIRARFENDPQQFMMFVMDEKNQEEMIRLGLATRIPPVIVPEPVIPPV